MCSHVPLCAVCCPSPPLSSSPQSPPSPVLPCPLLHSSSPYSLTPLLPFTLSIFSPCSLFLSTPYFIPLSSPLPFLILSPCSLSPPSLLSSSSPPSSLLLLLSPLLISSFLSPLSGSFLHLCIENFKSNLLENKIKGKLYKKTEKYI